MGYINKEVNENVTLGLLLRKDGAPITGENPTVEIRRLSDDLYLDFAATSPPYWISTGGQREQIMPETSWCPGLYEWIFAHGIFDYNNFGEYEIIYRNTGTHATIATEIVNFEVTAETLSDGKHEFDFPDSPGYSAGDGNSWEYILNGYDVITWKRQLWYKDSHGVLQALLENMPNDTPNNKPIIVGRWIRVV